MAFLGLSLRFCALAPPNHPHMMGCVVVGRLGGCRGSKVETVDGGLAGRGQVVVDTPLIGDESGSSCARLRG